MKINFNFLSWPMATSRLSPPVRHGRGCK
jgi:hypothetical protein